jgi:hypothetical protein
VNQHCYFEILARLREAARRRRLELWADAWILHHDNALAHDALAVREFLYKKSIMKLAIHHIREIGFVRLLAIPKTEDRFKGPTFRDMGRPSCRAFQKMSSRNV